ncbi:MAG: J domain-containing protein [Candidatus Acidiferrales bacterium]
MVKDYYRLLGLPRGAPLAEIKSAYRRLAAQYHPDKVAGLGPEVQEVAQAKMLELNEAMALLSDPARRGEYDEVLDLIPERPVPPSAAPAAATGETGAEAAAPLESAEGEAAPASESDTLAEAPKHVAAPAPAPSVSRELFLEQQGRELKTGVQGLAMHWRDTPVRGWQWVMESGDWRRTVVVAHRYIESLSLLSVRGFLSTFEKMVGERKLTTKGTTIFGVITYENLMDAPTVREQVQNVVSGTRGVFKTLTPIIVLHDARARRTLLFGTPTDYPEVKRVVRFLLTPRGA